MTTSAFGAHGARFFLLLAVLACTKPLTVSTEPAPLPAVPVTPGVSQALAQDRARRVSGLAYALAFTVPERKAEPIVASETVRFRLSDARQPLQLDFKEQTTSLKRLEINGQPVPIDHHDEHLVLPAASLKTGLNEVRMELVAGNQSLNRNDEYLYTLLVPDRARTVFPVFDQPNLKASFSLTLTVPRSWQAVANGPLQDSTVTAESKTYRFAPSDTISTYLFSFAAGRFVPVARTLAGRPMQLLHRETDPAKLRASLDPIFRLHADALAFLEQYTGLPYPFRKFDFTAIPDFQYGGMEHVGAIDYKAGTLFLDDGATRDQELARQNLINHETAHMWFGDLVTMQWFDDVWMKEVFANFMADKMSQADAEEQQLKFITDHYPSAYGVDRTAGANPIRQPLENLQEAGSLYGNIIYHKAPIMMRQLELLMGGEPFRQVVQEYLRQYAFRNATWPDLIALLDAHTPADLQAWNQVWVNQPGRPVFRYSRGGHDGQTVLEITQQAEDGSGRLWPQQFNVSLEFADGRTQERTVKMTGREATLKIAGYPRRIVFNSTGIGYGVFPVDTLTATGLADLQSPVTRAATYVNLYENLLRGEVIKPQQLLSVYRRQLAHETADLNVKLLTNQVSDIFWKFLTPPQRAAVAPALEQALWQAMQQSAQPGTQKLLFKAYQSVALTKEAQARLYRIWELQQAPARVKLTEDDYTALALALAVRDYPAPRPILPAQLTRIQNPDRRLRMQFLQPALAPDAATRDAFFASLQDEKNREKEAWVASALAYLHHPLRTAASEKYLPQSLELLEEIQRTGDIFFPYSWLQATLGYYQTPTAARTVREFLAARPTYNPRLRAKLLQAADDLFRAEKLAR